MKVSRTKDLDTEWQDWLKLNLERNCDPRELVEILVKNGFGLGAIKQHMGSLFPSVSLNKEDRPDYEALANFPLSRIKSAPNFEQVNTDKLQLFTLDGFLTEIECDRIVELSLPILRPSTVTTGDANYRTSTTSDLSTVDAPEVKALDEKIALTLGVRLPYSEGIQVQKYEVGQEFRQHTDYFQPNSEEYSTYAGGAGQRTWTFMVYLCNCTSGGGTKFYAINKIFQPRKGMAVIWNNLRSDGSPNPATLHSGMPVESGEKIIITKWFRDRGTGPMFY